MFYEGKNNVKVAIKLDIPQEQVTRLHSEYRRLQNQYKLESLYMVTKGKVSRLINTKKKLLWLQIILPRCYSSVILSVDVSGVFSCKPMVWLTSLLGLDLLVQYALVLVFLGKQDCWADG